jgi:hypothetical protein
MNIIYSLRQTVALHPIATHKDSRKQIALSNMADKTDEADKVPSEWDRSSAQFTRYPDYPSCSASSPPQASVTRQINKIIMSSKRNSEYFDPCQDAANRSLKCLRRNGGDRLMCQDYFE